MAKYTSVDGEIREIVEMHVGMNGEIHKIIEEYTAVDGEIRKTFSIEEKGDYLFDAKTGTYVLPKKYIYNEIDSGWIRNYDVTAKSVANKYDIVDYSHIAVYYKSSGKVENGVWWEIDASKYSKIVVTAFNSGVGEFAVLTSAPTVMDEFDWRSYTHKSITVSGNDTYEIDISTKTGKLYVVMYAYKSGSSNRTMALSQIKLVY
ncbi:MAG: hypothetical protein IKV10_02255 [Alphaproteobacteria bacterium]|nr:hypothetical protein [Alphaproteobacteria bacterium]